MKRKSSDFEQVPANYFPAREFIRGVNFFIAERFDGTKIVPGVVNFPLKNAILQLMTFWLYWHLLDGATLFSLVIPGHKLQIKSQAHFLDLNSCVLYEVFLTIFPHKLQFIELIRIIL